MTTRANATVGGTFNQNLVEESIEDTENYEGNNGWATPSEDDTPTLQIDALSTWLQTVSNHRLLSREQEIELAKRIEQNDESARDELVQANLRLSGFSRNEVSGT